MVPELFPTVPKCAASNSKTNHPKSSKNRNGKLPSPVCRAPGNPKGRELWMPKARPWQGLSSVAAKEVGGWQHGLLGCVKNGKASTGAKGLEIKKMHHPMGSLIQQFEPPSAPDVSAGHEPENWRDHRFQNLKAAGNFANPACRAISTISGESNKQVVTTRRNGGG